MPSGDLNRLAGVLGLGSQTPAVQALLPRTARRRRKKTTRKKATRRPARRKAPRKSASRKKKPARLVKGSPAAKRHMAKLRRMQKRNKR